MKLNLIIDEYSMDLELPDGERLAEREEFFRKMDEDMDRGWLFGGLWKKELNRLERCQIVADRLLGAIESHNEAMAMMMGGYIIARLPNIEQVVINTEGRPSKTEFN